MDETITIEHDGLRTPGTLTRPEKDAAPAVLLLHGTASSRDEVGGMFARLAEALAARGISSLRIDLAGCGDSDRPQTALTVASQVADAHAAFDRLAADEHVDEDRIAVLGFSQGGTIAALVTGEEPAVAALVTWSSGVIDWRATGFAQEFATDGDPVVVDLGFRTFTFSRRWWEEVQDADVAAAVAAFDRPVLAVAGARDEAVPPSASESLLAASASTDVTLALLPEAGHVLGALDDGSPDAAHVVALTADWLAARLRGA